MLLRALVIWLLLVVAAVANGAFREGVILPTLGERLGQAISSVLLSLIIVFITWASRGWMRIGTPRDAWTVGLVWLALTLAFEFLVGHYLFGNSWERLLADYELWEGRLWVLVLTATLLSPRLIGRWRERQ